MTILNCSWNYISIWTFQIYIKTCARTASIVIDSLYVNQHGFKFIKIIICSPVFLRMRTIFCHHFPIYLPHLSANLLASVSVMSLVPRSKPSLCIRCRGFLRISASENFLSDTSCTIFTWNKHVVRWCDDMIEFIKHLHSWSN